MTIDRLWLLVAGSVTAVAYFAVRLVHHRLKYRDLVWLLLACVVNHAGSSPLGERKNEKFKLTNLSSHARRIRCFGAT